MVYSTTLSTTLASTYGSGSYNSGDYNGASTTTSTGADTTGSGGLLANTGFDILLAVSIACLIIFIALMVRFWRRPKRAAAPAATSPQAAVGHNQPN